MSYRISEEKISEIRNSANIVDVVSEVVQLRKTGKNFLGLCPFHSEKTPSFTVSPDKQIFYCFGCGEGGNVFGFLMKHDRLTFPEAVRSLAKRNGIDIPEPQVSEIDRKLISERETLFKINRTVMDYFHGCLQSNSTGQKAMAYLTKRGISQKTIKAFHVGFAPDGWQNLLNFLQRKKIPTGLIEKAGLIIPKKDKNGFYDRFRDRIIFPIFNIGEQVVGFGGRATDNSLPKYLNSPETLLYNKRSLLYGLHRAKQKCRETLTVYIVEGYLDCLTLFQHGLENTVATLGTALTPEHIRILRGFAQKVILVFDSDEAGIKAATRSISLFMDQNVDARILVLPEGNDPDSYVLKNGTEKFEALSSQAFSIIEFLINIAVKKHGLSVEGKVEVVNELLEPMSALDDPVARSLYVKEVSERVGIDEAAILSKLNAFKKPGTGPSGGYQNSIDFRGKNADLKENNGNDLPGDKLERQIMSMMLQFPEVLTDIRQHNIVNYFKDPLLKSLGMIIIDTNEDSLHFISDILNKLENDRQKKIVAELSIQNHEWNPDGCKKLINRFLFGIQAKEEKSLIDEIKKAEENNNLELLVKLLGQKQKNAENIEKQKMTLMRKI